MTSLEKQIDKKFDKWAESLIKTPREVLGDGWKERINKSRNLLTQIDLSLFPEADLIEKTVNDDTFDNQSMNALYGQVYSYQQAMRELKDTANLLRTIRTKKQLHRTFKEAIETLQQEYDKVTVQIPTSKALLIVKVVTKPVILHCETYDEDVNFGRFEITVNIHPLTGELDGANYIRSIDKIYPPKEIAAGNRMHPHPHIRKTEVCMGEASDYLYRIRSIENLVDYVYIMNSLLNTYNANSPYVHIERWVEKVCVECGHTGPDGDFTQCHYCNNHVCKTCAEIRTCSSCGKVICKNHKGKRNIEKCEICSKSFCGYHINSRRKHECLRRVERESEVATQMLSEFDISSFDDDLDLMSSIYEEREEQREELEAQQASGTQTENVQQTPYVDEELDPSQTGFADD